MPTVIIYEGEVAVLGAQGEFELHVSWCNVLVYCRDLHDQLEYGKWGVVSGGVRVVRSLVVVTVGLDLIMAASRL